MIELKEVFDTDLSIMVFVYGSVGFLVISSLAAACIAGMHRRVLGVVRSFVITTRGCSAESASLHLLGPAEDLRGIEGSRLTKGASAGKIYASGAPAQTPSIQR